jgi:hypothetical protein
MRLVCSLALALSVFATSAGASAQASATSTATSTATATPTATPTATATETAPVRRGRRPWVIFDPVYSRFGVALTGGPVWWKPARSSNAPHELGFNLGIGASQETQKDWLFVGARVDILFYALDSKSFAITLPRYTYIAGLRLGPVEPEVGASLTLITADAFRGDFSAGLFSPGAHAGLGVNAGPIRIGAHAVTEYRWRWFGDVNYFFRGVAITLDLRRAMD